MRWLLVCALVLACGGERTGPVGPGSEPDGTDDTRRVEADEHDQVSACVKGTVSDDLGRANMLRLGGYLHRALVLAEATLERCRAPETLFTLAQVLADLGLNQRALEMLAAFLAMEPHDEHKGQARELVESIEKRPANVRAAPSKAERERAQLFYRAGVSLRLAGKHGEAVQRFRRAYLAAPHPAIIAQIALTHRAAGNEVEARKADDRTLAMAELISGKKAVPRLLLDHSANVSEVAWSPNGKLIASLSRDRTLKIWQVANGRVLDTVTLLDRANSVAFVDDHTVVFGGGRIGAAVGVYDIPTRQLNVAVGGAGALAVAPSPDGKHVAYGGFKDRHIGVRTLDKGDVVWRSLLPMTWRVENVAYRGDGGALGLAGDRVIVVNPDNGAQLYELPRHQKKRNLVAFSPDGRVVLSAGGDVISLHDATTGAKRRAMKSDVSIQAVRFSADGVRLFSAGNRGIRVWDVATGRRLASYANPTKFVAGLAVSPDGSTLAVAGGSSLIELIDARSGAAVRTFGTLGGRLSAVAVSRSGARLASGTTEGAIVLWRLDRIAAPQRLRHGKVELIQLAFGAGGKRLVSVDKAGGLVLWDARSGRRISELQGAKSVAFGADGTLYVGGGEGELAAHDARTGRRLRGTSGRSKREFRALALSPDGQTVAIGTDDGLRVQNLTTGRGVYEIKGMGDIDTVAFLPSGDAIAAGPVGHGWGLFDARNPGKPRVEPFAHDGADELAISPDGSRLVSAGYRDTSIGVFAAPAWSHQHSLIGHAGPVTDLAFEGDLLVSSSLDKTVRLWDAAAPRGIAAVYAGEDGAWLVVAADGRVDGARGAASQRRLFWQVGDFVLPGSVGWNRARTPGLLQELMGHR